MEITWMKILVGETYIVNLNGDAVEVLITDNGDTRKWTWDGNNIFGEILTGHYAGHKFYTKYNNWAERTVVQNGALSMYNENLKRTFWFSFEK